MPEINSRPYVTPVHSDQAGVLCFSVACPHATDGISHHVTYDPRTEHIDWNCPFKGPAQARQAATLLTQTHDCHTRLRGHLKAMFSESFFKKTEDSRFSVSQVVHAPADFEQRRDRLRARRYHQRPVSDSLLKTFVGALFAYWIGHHKMHAAPDLTPAYHSGPQQFRCTFTKGLRAKTANTYTIVLQLHYPTSGTIEKSVGPIDFAFLNAAGKYRQHTLLSAMWLDGDQTAAVFKLNNSNWREYYTVAALPPWQRVRAYDHRQNKSSCE